MHAPRRLPLRAAGLLAVLGMLLLAIVTVAAALMFRAAVQDNLAGIERAASRPDLVRSLTEAREWIDGGTIALICLAWLSITTVGALSLLFFSRLTSDIGAVRSRAMAILTGDRSSGTPLARNDELSDLGAAVDHLAETLARRERDLEMQRRHLLHSEKLATIGGMAAGVLREIGNPIAAIDGYARALADSRRAGECGPGNGWCEPRLLLQETDRLVTITRQMSSLADAPASEPQLQSLNEIVKQSLALLRYEPRLDDVKLDTSLDPQLPAIHAVADHMVQLVINLVTNAADATAQLPPHTARIELATRQADGGVELTVQDNGCGMSEDVLAHAFEPLFTTKPPGVGTGLGLPLCRSVARAHGGSMNLESEAGSGTRARLWLPLPEGTALN
jgi:two-component system NtrC family sensor kinase